MTILSRLDDELSFVYDKIIGNLDEFDTLVPAAVSIDNVYPAVENQDWTDGFWIGMLHLAQEYRYSPAIAEVIEHQLSVFQQRLDDDIVLDHHDIGFLYSLSAVADYRENGTERSKKMALQAADKLMKRYSDSAKVFQAWGDMNDEDQRGRMIIDCNMNLPLLYFASDYTGNPKYRDAASNHVKNAQQYLIRDDYSTYHTFYMDTVTGKPRFGKTAQGFSDESCWARGQAWGIYGFPISFNHIGDTTLLDSACHLADYFVQHLPADYVCYWDLYFNDGSGQERDTSAASIAACGLLELSRNLPLSSSKRHQYEDVAVKIMTSLADNYTTKDLPESNGILTQGVYSKPQNNGVNECTTWGDYYYMEALIRLYKSWNSFW